MSKEKDKTESSEKVDEDQADSLLSEEYGGYKQSGLPEPTRYGDWDVRGRCSDF